MAVDPFTMLMVGSQILGAGMNARSQRQMGAASAQGLEFEANITEARGKQEESLLRRKGRKQIGRMRSAIGKSGVTMEGSPMDAIAGQAAEIEIDALNARFDAETAARLKRMEAKNVRKQAKSASGASLIGGGLGAIGGLF